MGCCFWSALWYEMTRLRFTRRVGLAWGRVSFFPSCRAWRLLILLCSDLGSQDHTSCLHWNCWIFVKSHSIWERHLKKVIDYCVNYWNKLLQKLFFFKFYCQNNNPSSSCQLLRWEVCVFWSTLVTLENGAPLKGWILHVFNSLTSYSPYLHGAVGPFLFLLQPEALLPPWWYSLYSVLSFFFFPAMTMS